jgi:hypothetical protein
VCAVARGAELCGAASAGFSILFYIFLLQARRHQGGHRRVASLAQHVQHFRRGLTEVGLEAIT